MFQASGIYHVLPPNKGNVFSEKSIKNLNPPKPFIFLGELNRFFFLYKKGDIRFVSLN